MPLASFALRLKGESTGKWMKGHPVSRQCLDMLCQSVPTTAWSPSDGTKLLESQVSPWFVTDISGMILWSRLSGENSCLFHLWAEYLKDLRYCLWVSFRLCNNNLILQKAIHSFGQIVLFTHILIRQLRPFRYTQIQMSYSNICFHFYVQSDTPYQASPVTYLGQLICLLGGPAAPY